MITVEMCPDCRGENCERYQEQRNRWERTLGIMKMSTLAITQTDLLIREFSQELAISGASPTEGGELHLAPGTATYEVHVFPVEAGTRYLAAYSGEEDPMELVAAEPLLTDESFARRRIELHWESMA
jgi:hypothetical protein